MTDTEQVITAEQLSAHGFTSGQIALFRVLYPQGLRVTPETRQEARTLGLTRTWETR
jgi:hypothetical protein